MLQTNEITPDPIRESNDSPDVNIKLCCLCHRQAEQLIPVQHVVNDSVYTSSMKLL